MRHQTQQVCHFTSLFMGPTVFCLGRAALRLIVFRPKQIESELKWKTCIARRQLIFCWLSVKGLVCKQGYEIG